MIYSTLKRSSKPKEKRKKNSKIYAKENRRRKKEYIKELENKVALLEQTVEKLNYEIWNLKKDAYINKNEDDKSGNFDFLEMESMLRERIKNSSQLETDFKTEQFQDILNNVLPNGQARKNLLNFNFRMMFDNVSLFVTY